ncbi:unnamed protein product [Caretta caretta]
MSKEVRRAQENGLTLLHLVVVQGNVEKVKFLLSREANVDSQLDCGYTPFIVAVQKRSPEICSALIEHGADVNVADKDGWSPLHFAAQNRDDRIALLLLGTTRRGQTPKNVKAGLHSTWHLRTTSRTWLGCCFPARLTPTARRMMGELPSTWQLASGTSAL